MKMNRLLFFGLSLLLSSFLGAQVDMSLIQKAKAAGVSESQIQEALKSRRENVEKKRSNTTLDNIDSIAYEADLERSYYPIDSLQLDIDKMVFGREIFYAKNLNFAPSFNVATPENYVLGAGDEVRIDLWGSSELRIAQRISRDGQIYINGLGFVTIGGMKMERAENRLLVELSKMFSGLNDGTVSFSLSLGKMRSLKVNVIGEAMLPGTYTLPANSTIFNALYAAGGVNDIGSLRAVKVYRNDKLMSNFDVYDYLFDGKSEDNIALEDGDLVMVLPYENLVNVKGELKRTRLFEMKEGETLSDLLVMTGGFKGNAYKESVVVERKNEEYYTVKTVNSDQFSSFEMMDGDTLFVKGVAQRYNNRISIQGAVWYPGNYELNEEVNSVKTLVNQAAGLKGDEFAGRALVTRVNSDFTKSMFAVDIKKIMSGEVEDFKLQGDDILYIPSTFALNEDFTIKISGAVNKPLDDLAYFNNMTVEDAIILAGGLKESAAAINVDISRRVKNASSTSAPNKIVEVFTVELKDGLAIDKDGVPIALKPFDEIYVRYSPGYREQEVISVGGEIMFKGSYVLKSAQTRLSDIIKDAGGLSEEAYTKGASLMRKMSDDEKKKVEVMLKVVNSNASRDSVGKNDLQIESYSVGIDLAKAIAHPGSDDDIILRDGDVLFVPKMQSTVKISGAVLYPNSVTYKEGMKAKDYIRMAGGYSDFAKKRPIVVYMNGKVATTKGCCIPKIEPGCEILVPTKRHKDRASWAEIMSIATSTTSMAAMVVTLINSFLPK